MRVSVTPLITAMAMTLLLWSGDLASTTSTTSPPIPSGAYFVVQTLPAAVSRADRDGDGIPNRQDTCPNKASTANGCPAPTPADGRTPTRLPPPTATATAFPTASTAAPADPPTLRPDAPTQRTRRPPAGHPPTATATAFPIAWTGAPARPPTRLADAPDPAPVDAVPVAAGMAQSSGDVDRVVEA
jgi:hypothetical protein